MLRSTVGQLLVNDALPPDLRDYSRILHKKDINKLLQQVAEKYPERYTDISHKLATIGHEAAYHTGGFSFGLGDMQIPPEADAVRARLHDQVNKILMSKLDDTAKERATVKLLQDNTKEFEDSVFEGMKKTKNPLALQVISGARGSPGNLRSIVGGDLLYVDHRDRPIPVPILHGYAQGLSPVEYWAGSFGTRKGTVDLKFSTQDAGFLGKQLNQVAHRLVVTDHDAPPGDPHHQRGLPVDSGDLESSGALLARDVGGYKRNTVLTPKILTELHGAGHAKILIRSPMVGGPEKGGLYSRDVGVRERGGLAPIGDFVGHAAAQAIAEPVSQAQISSKHTGGVAGAGTSISGFKYINQMVQVPKVFRDGATHSQVDGRVAAMWKAPAGGHYVMINGTRHFITQGLDPHVKVGDTVEAGDVISEGLPNPAEFVRHKGIGEGRRSFMHTFRKVLQDSGLPADRRNIEIQSRGLINHVRLVDELGDFTPGDVVPYDVLEHLYKPRDGHEITEPKRAVGKYLEQPVLHHTIGTKIRPAMLPEFKHFDVNSVVVHPDPPPFEPEMIRGMEQMQHDPDWMTRHLGSNLKKSTLTAAHRGAVSDELGTSFVPGLARAVDFGRVGLTKGWDPKKVVKPEMP